MLDTVAKNLGISFPHMYPALLAMHSLVRWLVLTSLLLSLIRAYAGWLHKKRFSHVDHILRHWTATFTHIQLVLGLTLYTISPFVDYFIHHFPEAVHLREVRFFGMEHSLMMFIAVTLVTIGSMKAKRAKEDSKKFKLMAIWFSVALLIIFLSIPWQFSPFTRRPYFRPF
ncbi:hypothetical protein GCM10023231_41250 [Olivibacter ginsenosidimutans]|uniref:Cytochrome B n=1 Tax=Olivibacter ginsenosidimutans TaxID=1176537 RepID=A0ABP9CGV2_9SPHI